MKLKILLLAVILGIGFISLSAFKPKTENYKPVESLGNPWDGYRSWTKITKDEPNTGDPTGFVEKKHSGKMGYREIYINSVGAATQAGSSPATGDWGFVMGTKGKVSTGTSKWAKFCSHCHVYAASNDYVFMNADFMATLKK